MITEKEMLVKEYQNATENQNKGRFQKAESGIFLDILYKIFLMKIFTLTCLILFSSITLLEAQSRDIFDEISVSIRSGNPREVSKFFNSTVEMTIPNSENIYSKTQAEHILRDFFAAHPPTVYNIIHKGASSQNAQYAIGKLQTANGNFRTYIFVKESGGRFFIQELRFEKE
jgi:hypothetical protein